MSCGAGGVGVGVAWGGSLNLKISRTGHDF